MYFSPRIVTSGLIFLVDAADKNSYPGTGTTWKDLSGNNYTGTLTNGPTFNSANRGSIVFDGVDDYVDFGTSAINQNFTNFSISFWIRPTAFPANGGSPISIFGKDDTGCGSSGLGIFINCNGRLIFSTPVNNCPGGSISALSGPLLTLNVWNFITFVYDSTTSSGGVNLTGYNYLLSSTYISGIYNYPAVFNNSATLKIGKTGTRSVYQGDFCGGTFVSSAYFSGNIACLSVYNKLLTSTNVEQNYNATKIRFGL